MAACANSGAVPAAADVGVIGETPNLQDEELLSWSILARSHVSICFNLLIMKPRGCCCSRISWTTGFETSLKERSSHVLEKPGEGMRLASTVNRSVYTPTVHTCNMCFSFVCSASEGHELLEPFQFISDAAVEAAFEVIAGLLASFGCTQPNMAKYKVSCSALECFGPDRSEVINL